MEFTQWLKNNWLITLIIVMVVGFIALQSYSMASQISIMNNTLNDKIDEIEELQKEIAVLEITINNLNEELLAVQKNMKRTTALFWNKFNKIKKESENQTPEQLIEDWMQSWPGGS